MAKKNRNIPQMKGGPVQPKFSPAYNEEQRMTIEKAMSIVAEETEIRDKANAEASEILAKANVEKDRILEEAKVENERLVAENERLSEEITARTEESQRVLGTFMEQRDTLRLNAEAQAIIDDADLIRAKAQAEADKVEGDALQHAESMVSKAQAEAEAIRKKAEDEIKAAKEKAADDAVQMVAEATKSAHAQAVTIQKDAESKATEILDAARQEEQRIIERKENIAEMAAQSVRQSAEDYAQRVRQKADEYSVHIREQADQAAGQIARNAEEQAEKIMASAQELIDSQVASNNRLSEKLHAAEIEFTKRKNSIPEEVQRLAQERTAKIQERLAAQSKELSRKEGELHEKEDAIVWEREALAEEKSAFNDRLENEVASRYAQLQSALTAAREHEGALITENTELQRQVNALAEKYKRLRGTDVAELQNEVQRLREDLRIIRSYGIGVENAKAIADAQTEVVKSRKIISDLSERLTEARNAAALSAGTEEKLAVALSSSETYQRMVEDLMKKLDERKSVTRSLMLKPIQEPPKFLLEQRATKDPEQFKDEVEWLEHIQKQSEKSGIILSSRFLYAYHTSLKIGEWSPLVVLAGVSGTGKSELPKQYAHHGGIHFLSVPVKPDWDSPASLFGYYNAIENRFEATELLRALYQMQEECKNEMFLVLLDEMNLAHPEQYFADLLSKFEENRGSNLPAEYDIMLGAGEPPEKLSIARNVLWTGTMNEDETTKGLSDKVTDRSVIITFPCPKVLHDRDNTRIQPPELSLSRSQWEKWKANALSRTASEDLAKKLDEKKEIIQQINNFMSIMGRNLGHRVWQAIENYILNYPSVIATGGNAEEIEKAFCDAVAFKMMPKLRGLETRGSNENSLINIRNVLPEQLRGDFIKACEQTSEVFRWNSADFMEES